MPWSAVVTTESVVLKQVVYGQLPDGFRQLSHGVQALTTGCYVAELDGMAAGGSGYARFAIDSSGRATELSRTGQPNER